MWIQNREYFVSHRILWIRPNQHLMISLEAELPFLQCIYYLTHWAPEKKKISWGKLYFWKTSFPIAQKVYSKFLICPKHNRESPCIVQREFFFCQWEHLKFCRWIISKFFPPKVINTYLLCFLCFHIELRLSPPEDQWL